MMLSSHSIFKKINSYKKCEVNFEIKAACFCNMWTGKQLTTKCTVLKKMLQIKTELECEQMPNMMADLPNIGGALCSTPQSLADAHYYSAVQ